MHVGILIPTAEPVGGEEEEEGNAKADVRSGYVPSPRQKSARR